MAFVDNAGAEVVAVPALEPVQMQRLNRRDNNVVLSRRSNFGLLKSDLESPVRLAINPINFVPCLREQLFAMSDEKAWT